MEMEVDMEDLKLEPTQAHTQSESIVIVDYTSEHKPGPSASTSHGDNDNASASACPAPVPAPNSPEKSQPIPTQTGPNSNSSKLMYDVLNSDERTTLTVTKVLEICPELINVEYPGIVVNNDRAIRTMGGILNVSDTFCNPRKKLEVRYRPGDVYCNPVLGEGSTTCGFLLRIRRPKKHRHHKKNPKQPNPEAKLIDLESQEPGLPEPIPLTEEERYNLFEGQQIKEFSNQSNDAAIVRTKYSQQNQGIFHLNTPNGDFLQTNLILAEEEKLIEDYTRQKIRKNLVVSNTPTPSHIYWQQNKMDSDSDRILLQVPQKTPTRSGWDIEVLGIIPKIYKFTGLVDFQYLPMTKDEKTGKHVSIYSKILPVFGDGDGPTSMYAGSDLFMKATKGEAIEFIVPPFMSRLDKPMIASARVMEASSDKQITTVTSNRPKRVIFSHLCNFRDTDDKVYGILPRGCMVPTEPIPEAITAVKRRLISEEYMETFKKLFEERPIWTRQAIEYKLKCDKYITKYILPCVAYFSLNGPWRSCWIKLGLDPRMSRQNFVYQLIDYRFPSNYRSLLPKVSPGDESLFACRPDCVPPKAQMFYQMCELHIPEVQELISTTMKRIQDEELCAGEFEFTPKNGFLKDEYFEYCRYAISRNLELYFLGKNLIPTITLNPVPLLPGGIVPKNAFKSASQKNSGTYRSRSHRPKFTLEKERRIIEDDEESNLADEFRIPIENLEDEEVDEDRVLNEVFGSDDEEDEEDEDVEIELLEGEEVFTPDEILKELGQKP